MRKNELKNGHMWGKAPIQSRGFFDPPSLPLFVGAQTANRCFWRKTYVTFCGSKQRELWFLRRAKTKKVLLEKRWLEGAVGGGSYFGRRTTRTYLFLSPEMVPKKLFTYVYIQKKIVYAFKSLTDFCSSLFYFVFSHILEIW